MVHGAKNMQHGAKNMEHGAKNVKRGAKKVQHCVENERHGAKRVWHGFKMCGIVGNSCRKGNTKRKYMSLRDTFRKFAVNFNHC